MKSIFSRLILSFLAILLIAIFFISIFFTGLLKNYLVKQKEEELKNKGIQIVELSRRFIYGNMDEITFSYLLNTIDYAGNSRTLIIDRSGTIINSPFKVKGRENIYPKKGMRLNDIDISKIFNGSIIIKNGFNPIFNEPMITVGIPVTSNDGSNIVGAVILNSPVNGVTEAIHKTNIILISSSFGALALSLITAYFLSKTLSKPIHTISKAALEIAEGNYSKNVDIKRKDEIGILASSFNYLSKKLYSTISDLNNEKRKLSDILYSMEEGLIAVDSNLNIIHINPAACKLLSIENSEISSLNNIDDNKNLIENVNEVLRSAVSKSYKFNINESVFVNTLISPLKYSDGKIYGAIILLQDISESAKLEKMRRDFIANVSHELRTPLTSIRGFIEPLIDGTVDDDEARLKYNKIIRDETLRLERLINDLLDLSRLQSGKVVLDIQKVNLTELISNVLNKFQPIFTSKKIEFSFNTLNEPAFILADGDRVEQLLFIFIDNAVKYTPEKGKIEVTLTEEDMHYKISIKDNGIGIPKEDIPYIWERFYKVDKSRTNKSSGTGLGLSIAKNIIELHGQKVWVKSGLGEGTTFEFTMKKA